jgi:5'-3' exonuclease
MGIKSNFNSFLRDTCPIVFEEIHISEFSFMKVAIDISLYMHKYKAVCGDRWLSAFIHLIASLRRNEIHCVFIFDGRSPPEKEIEHSKRKDTREKLESNLFEIEEAFNEYNKTGIVEQCLINLYNRKKSPKRLLSTNKSSVDMAWIEKKIEQRRSQLYHVSTQDFEDAKELFRILNVPYYTAPGEAEKMCSYLCIKSYVSAVLSEDTDVMAYGAPLFLTKIDTSSDTCIRISHTTLLSSLELEKEQFLDFCIMCGTDYNSNIPKIGSKNAYKKILQYKNIDTIGKETGLDISILNHERVRTLFTEFNQETCIKIPFCGTPDFAKLETFVRSHCIQINIEKLKKDFTHNVIVFEDDSEDEIKIIDK